MRQNLSSWTHCEEHRSRWKRGESYQGEARGRGSPPSLPRLLPVQAALHLDQEGSSCPSGPKPEAKAASGWCAWVGGGEGTHPHIRPCAPLRPSLGTGWLTFGKARRCDRGHALSPDLSCAEQLAGRWHCVTLSVPTQFALYACQESSSY